MLGSLAKLLYRNQGPVSREAREWSARLKASIYFGCGLVLVGLFTYAFSSHYKQWKGIRPSVRIDSGSWRVLKADASSAGCGDLAVAPGSCPASPSNPSLWSSLDGRLDPKVRPSFSAPAAAFWLGVSISAEKLQLAAREGAGLLVLGWIYAGYTIWIDGERIQSGKWTDNEPIALPISAARLEQNRPMHIAVRIQNDDGHGRPDAFTYSFGETVGEGFYTKASASAYRRLLFFSQTVRPFALFVANALVTILFFLVWVSGRQRREYFYFAGFTIIGSIFQLLHTDLVYLSLDLRFVYFANACLIVYEGAFGALMGLAYARSRKEIFVWAIPISLLAPIAAFFVAGSPAASFELGRFFNNIASPLLHAIGAAACFIQAHYLYRQQSTGSYLPVRIRRLTIFGVGLLGLGALNVLQGAFWNEIGMVNHMILYRFGHFGLVLFMASVVLREYRKQLHLIRQTPVSLYHRRPTLPDRVGGIVMAMDLKSSERLFRAGASQDSGGEYVRLCMSHLWSAVNENSGVVLQSEGDSLMIFFDSVQCSRPLENAFQTIDAMLDRLSEVRTQLISSGALAMTDPELSLRAGVVQGELKPVWQGTGHDRRASWIEAGNSNAFVESSRLMEIERQIPGSPSGTRVLIAEAACASEWEKSAPKLKGELVRGQRLKGKHGVEYHFAVYSPRSKSLSGNSGFEAA